MCMSTYIGTTSEQDLGQFNSDKIRFIRSHPNSGEERALKYKNVWFLTDPHESCSCGFRYVEFPNVEHLGFGVPEDWSPEDEESIKATHQTYAVIDVLLAGGHKVESISFWIDSERTSIDEIVSLESVPVEAFRFFDGYRFEYHVNA